MYFIILHFRKNHEILKTGRIYTIPVHQLPGGRGDGMPITTFAEIGIDETIVQYLVSSPDKSVLLSMDSGYGFAAKTSDMMSRVRNGKSFISLEDGETLLPPLVIPEASKSIGVLSEKGRFLLFDATELRVLSSGGHGVILMGLDKGEKIRATLPVDDNGCLVICMAKNDNRYEVRISGNQIETYTGKRARKGKPVETRFTPASLENIK